MKIIITLMHINDLVLWDYVQRADTHEVFVCWSEDYAPYCEFKFENL